ncbi:O-antigen ligase family protein [Methylobacterium marchantiae]|uniref:O-antigen ligase family protein n=1 Tax=Methylobacterium marchantiae TaxID=600331 RepID=A0ABW3WWG2_9HYPH|nr:hypothetical protein AIGOOFII_2850 [Methylobacterium marchantiae]
MNSITEGPGSRWRAGAWSNVQAIGVLRGFASLLHAAFIFFACFAFSAASPYDIIAIPTILLWLCLGIRLYRGALPLAVLLVFYIGTIVVALMPYLGEPDPVAWTIQLAYLAITAIFFSMLYADHSRERVELALKAYLASCLFSASLGIVGYAGLTGSDELFARWGRAAGSFQDPNVFGSFLTLGVLYLLHGLLLGTSRRPLFAFLALLFLLVGILLSFSRGSWGGSMMAIVVMVSAIYRTSTSRTLRRRIVSLSLLAGLGGAVAIGGVLSIGTIGETFSQRASVTQDYDEGETGRFGNQLRGLGQLIEEPMGMGPLRWRRTFGLEPHNSYIGSFANGGWIGGITFICLVLATAFVGFRLMFHASPFQRHAQIVFPALLMFFFQAVQIDIEKWRHVYMMLGMVWGLEAARIRWMAHRLQTD